MKTKVIMKRKILGGIVSQDSKTGMLSATDLIKIGNMWRISKGLDMFKIANWLKNKGTKEFIAELEKKYGVVKKNSRGKGSHTWFHPLLFIDSALAISPTIKIEVYEWLFDNLLSLRNDSGDSYKKMCGCLYVRSTNKRNFPYFMQHTANLIKNCLQVDNWQKATLAQLAKRDKIHNDICLLSNVLNNNDEAVRLSLLESKK